MTGVRGPQDMHQSLSAGKRARGARHCAARRWSAQSRSSASEIIASRSVAVARCCPNFLRVASSWCRSGSRPRKIRPAFGRRMHILCPSRLREQTAWFAWPMPWVCRRWSWRLAIQPRLVHSRPNCCRGDERQIRVEMCLRRLIGLEERSVPSSRGLRTVPVDEI